ncbi:hypothetical protein L1277_002507 [Okibacterium sp. HSC-33S16]|uniref:hypothetical protein n=1 Tax=Okibacterium sp. HSC-33S16 TaxID=2910965 RepID=UPI00209CA310|nr:hypothetical protein [Okibacterium sp. HSC-33S16]MCP2032404.1 hypothetical protein [Okibacterium sp. HSC-33S16]
MASVDPTDDSLWRWVLYEYRFDPERNQKRNVVVAAFDNEDEFRRAFDDHLGRLHAELAAGTRSSFGSVTGRTMPPGHLAAQKRGHDVRRAIEHGVDPAPVLRHGPLPEGMAVLSLSSFELDEPSG